ncbi:hypothetical protein NDU88_003738 [Pleurodeles waltl]|uniref:Uncharacterized protein n=1 Tax=Pleurodeles waltl TaxID=8319 RepID=A0AAV7RDS1_PLEWA|nr:hypothetical protein NDU88_003738 [Pleurodeles waltl]
MPYHTQDAGDVNFKPARREELSYLLPSTHPGYPPVPRTPACFPTAHMTSICGAAVEPCRAKWGGNGDGDKSELKLSSCWSRRAKGKEAKVEARKL